MTKTKLAVIALAFLVVVGAIIVATALYTPDQTNPAYAASVSFVDAAASGNDEQAMTFLSDDLSAYVNQNCADGKISACIDAYIPDEWGAFQSVVFRRATPDGVNWNVDLIGTWEHDRGFSGVCIYVHLTRETESEWRIDRWAGFAWCGDPATRDMAANPEAPNQAP